NSTSSTITRSASRTALFKRSITSRCVTRAQTFIPFFFTDTATTEIYTLSLHDALPISPAVGASNPASIFSTVVFPHPLGPSRQRSEEHTSELQSRSELVCRLLLEKKKRRAGQKYYSEFGNNLPLPFRRMADPARRSQSE